MKHPAAVLLCLLSLAIPASAYVTIFSRDDVVPRPFGGTETVSISVAVRNADVVVRPAPGSSTVLYVYTRTDTEITISKYEESGGYAHGIAYWVNDAGPQYILYSYSKNGAVALNGFQADTTLKIQLYRFVLIVRDYLDPQCVFVTSKDTTGPRIAISPEPGAYRSVTIVATSTDDGAGVAVDQDPVTTYEVRRTSTGEIAASGTGTHADIDEEGSFDVSFTASDLLGNRATSPPHGDSPTTYTIDNTPPMLLDAIAFVLARSDHSLDVSLQFVLSDAGVGVSPSTMAVQVSDESGSSWSFGPADLIQGAENGGILPVSLPVVNVPRSARLRLDVTAGDGVGNTLELTDVPFELANRPVALGASVLPAGITGEAFRRGSELVPRYRVPIAVDRSRDEVQSALVARFRILRHIGSSGLVETVAELAPGAFASRLVEQDGQWVYWDVLEGISYAHRSLSYEIETVFSVTGIEVTAVEGAALLPNIEAWEVELAEGTICLQTYSSLDTVAPEVLIDSLEEVTVTIAPDPEGDLLEMRLMYSGPGGISGTSPKDGWAQRIVLTDAVPGAPDGAYRIRYLVSEAGNPEPQASPEYTIVVDRNCDVIDHAVVWNQYRLMTGSVIIRDGGSLLVTKDALVDVAQMGSLTITVRPGGRLELEPGSVFQPKYWQPGEQPGAGWECWGGIVADESAGGKVASLRVAGAIRGALRGVTVHSGADARIEGASIEQCRTGVHAIGAGAEPVIDHTQFTGSARYAIKEDLGASPLVTYCEFAANTYDYYDEVLTVVDAEGVNGLRPENSGNISVGGTR
jgi:hypothetical protein